MALPFGRIGIQRPEQFPRLFRIYRQGTLTTDMGRERLGEMEPRGEARCILSIARPDEIERFNQFGVKVTHDIIQRGLPAAAPNDIFALIRGGKETRWFRVQAIHNKGELDIDTVYYCEERSDRG